MNTILTEVNLKAGINYWLNKKKNWPTDFHNGFYEQLDQLKQNGLNEQWWQEIVYFLTAWKANRPYSGEDIYRRGLTKLDLLQSEYALISEEMQSDKLTLENTDWEILSSLYKVAYSIKNVTPPVFGSKLCHFMLPRVFPVIDQDVIGVNGRSYKAYWTFCKVQWSDCDRKEDLIHCLQENIYAPIVEYYPWATKVTELCIIGSKNQ